MSTPLRRGSFQLISALNSISIFGYLPSRYGADSARGADRLAGRFVDPKRFPGFVTNSFTRMTCPRNTGAPLVNLFEGFFAPNRIWELHPP
jgi:hypothetical protein